MPESAVAGDYIWVNGITAGDFTPSISIYNTSIVIMSDSVAGLLLELYETNRATAYSNLLVGIVFGEQPLGLL